MTSHGASESNAPERSVLTPAERESGVWIPESAALAMTGLQLKTFRAARSRGSLHAVPEVRGPGGQGRRFWYLRDDIERIVARRSVPQVSHSPGGEGTYGELGKGENYLLRELELSMAKSDAKELELALARAQASEELTKVRSEAQVEVTRLQGELTLAKSLLAELETKYQRTLAALGAMTGLSIAP